MESEMPEGLKVTSSDSLGALPKEPPPGLLMSMAIRLDHGLGVPGYYDGLRELFGKDSPTHAQRLECTLRQMRQLYEEVSGQGFYSPEREAEYAAMLPPDAQSQGNERSNATVDRLVGPGAGK